SAFPSKPRATCAAGLLKNDVGSTSPRSIDAINLGFMRPLLCAVEHLLGAPSSCLAQENAVSVVRDNTELNRFEMGTEAGLAIADYRLNGFTMTIYHTEVPARLRGRGHGGRL